MMKKPMHYYRHVNDLQFILMQNLKIMEVEIEEKRTGNMVVTIDVSNALELIYVMDVKDKYELILFLSNNKINTKWRN